MGVVLGTQLPLPRACQHIDTAESLAEPTLRHMHKRHKIAEQSLSPSENQARWGIKQMVSSLLTFQSCCRQSWQQLRFRWKAEKEWEWGTNSMVVPLGTMGVQGGPSTNSPSGREMSCELWTEAEMKQTPTTAKIIFYDDTNIVWWY